MVQKEEVLGLGVWKLIASRAAAEKECKGRSV
jgi:hypothetical protein